MLPSILPRREDIGLMSQTAAMVGTHYALLLAGVDHEPDAEDKDFMFA